MTIDFDQEVKRLREETVAPQNLRDFIASTKESFSKNFANKITQFLESFNYELNQDVFFSFVKDIIHEIPYTFASRVHLLDIKNPDTRFEVAKITAQLAGRHLSLDIKNFQINDPDRLYELAKIAHCSNSYDVSEYLGNFEITDPDRLFELAKIAAVRNPYNFPADLKYYKITDPERLYELAKPGVSQSKYIQDYRITDPERLFQIAKINAVKHTWDFSEHIKKYNITDQDQLFELAMVAVENNPYGLSEYFGNYGIQDPLRRYHIAKKAAHENGNRLAQNIKNFGITDPDQLLELAKIAKSSEYIGNFKITDQDRLYELALMTSQSKNFAFHFPNYGIVDPNRRYEIAKIVSEKYSIASYILNFKLTSENQLVEIVKMNAKKDGLDVLANLESYNINNQQHLREIATLAYTQMANNFIDNEIYIIDNNHFYIIETTFDPDLEKALNIPALKEKINSWQNPIIRKKLEYLLKVFVALCRLHPEQKLLATFLNNHPELLQTVFQERELALYWPLLNKILHLQEVPTTISAEKQMVSLLSTNQKILKCDLHDARLRTPLMLVLIKVDNNSILEWILENPKDKQQIINRCWIVNAIKNLGGEISDQVSPTITLTQLFQKVLPELKSENLETKLQQTFFTMRNPMAIFIYTGSLATLQDSKAIQNLTLFINSIFENTFLQVRQNPATNAHLKFLQEKNPDILARYHQGCTKQVELQEAENEASHETLRKIIQNALTHKHLNDDDFSKINMNLIPQEERGFRQFKEGNLPALESTIKTLSQQKGRLNKKNPEEFKQLENHITYLKLQLFLLKLTKETVTEANYNECNTAFRNALKKEAEFRKDLDLMAGVFDRSKDHNTIVLANTDDPYEILLCGSEVAGSCQRLEGNPKLNVGLLGYLLNGQTRLLTLKTNNTIKGRAIIRLLINDLKTPFLFIEDIYPQTLDKKFKDAIIDFAQEIADKMKITLVGIKKSSSLVKLQNLGCLATEYVDSASGLKDSTYEINGSFIL